MAKLMKQHTTSMEIFPIDTLINIFSRLQIPCLLRLKSVCKSWRTLISSRYFSNVHLNNNSHPSQRLLIFVGQDHSLYSVSLDYLQFPAFKIPFSSAWDRFSRRKIIVGSCNGLLVCINDESSDFEAVLINPSTFPCRNVPKLEVPQKCLYLSYGFGYNYLNDDYKIVRISHFLSGFPGGERMDVSVAMYSLRSNSWKLVVNMVVSPFGTPVSSNGTLVKKHLLHWLLSSVLENEQKHCIACFDVCNEQWTDVGLPDVNVSATGCVPKELSILDGCLCLMTDNRNNSNRNLWVLKDYGGVEQRWSKLFNTSDWFVIGNITSMPITCSEQGNEILLRKDEFSDAFWYNESEKTIRKAEFCGLPQYRQVSVCIRSLVSLFTAKHK